jgi:mannose-1-phosphate guanylyltransferase
MRRASNVWAVVLAAGDGRRLQELTTTIAGEVIPKQFCAFRRRTCLLEDAIHRAQAVAPSRHICTVVAAKHRRWWSDPLNMLSRQNIFVQPKNRGTAHGVLFALLQIQRHAPNCVVIMLPADHYVRDETTIARSLRMAANLAADNQHFVYLLGAEPDRPDHELGYIVPSKASRAAATVIRFVEKPTRDRARQLIDDGALWNTFIFAGTVRALLTMFEGRFAATAARMRDAIALIDSMAGGDMALTSLYQGLDISDFSKDVLERQERMLQVMRIPPCGWTDLGTPQRVAETVRILSRDKTSRAKIAVGGATHVDLASTRWRPMVTAGC